MSFNFICYHHLLIANKSPLAAAKRSWMPNSLMEKVFFSVGSTFSDRLPVPSNLYYKHKHTDRFTSQRQWHCIDIFSFGNRIFHSFFIQNYVSDTQPVKLVGLDEFLAELDPSDGVSDFVEGWRINANAHHIWYNCKIETLSIKGVSGKKILGGQVLNKCWPPRIARAP